jgi:hypothetical protein
MTKLWRSGPPLLVDTDAAGGPVSFRWNGAPHRISTICNTWRVHSEWWRDSIWRDYYKIETKDGFLCTIYHDLVIDTWHLARIYD